MPASSKKKPSTLWFLLLGLLLVWFASTWWMSFFATVSGVLESDHLSPPARAKDPRTGKRRQGQRSAKDLSSFFQEQNQQPPHINQPHHEMLQRDIQEHASKQEYKTLSLTAYLEEPLPPYDATKTPRLPSRTPGPLKQVVYDTTSCADFPNAFPVLVPPKKETDPTDCPILADPFLPWIHDAFVSQDVVEFIAHNQRRCHTNPQHYYERLAHLEPQAILQQSVPIKKIGTNRYQLTSLEEADVKETRFICRFHDSEDQTIGETLSRFPYNYEHANLQKKNSFPLLTRPKDPQDVKTALHNEQVWNSLLHFQCPLPEELKMILVQPTTAPPFYVDVVPIRTYGRLDKEGYFDRASRGMRADGVIFDPLVEWGTNHILPPIDQSGRWANIPLCPARQHVKDDDKEVAIQQKDDAPPPHFLTACVWASASFSTRGSSDADTSTSERLLEWMTYQLYMAGFDHIYIYDNSQGEQTLEPVLHLFPSSKVTRIPWKHPVCNNNRPGAPDPGERNSQYAAETSCRVRFGQDTKWMAVLDIDEYFIPQEPYESIQDWLRQKYSKGDTKILSFYQTRAVPNRESMDPIPSADGNDLHYQWKKKPQTTFLETYNCDRHKFPKPGWAWRAKKQIFQPSYVKMHFVHYSLVTQRLLDHPTEASGLYNDHAPYEKRVNEQTEAFLLHTKTTSPQATQYWRKQCPQNKDNTCPIGLAFPAGVQEGAVNEEGMLYNCYAHDRVSKDLVPRLKSLLEPLQRQYKASA